jgi:O-antigen/teichoic acid export membrane protein
MGFIQKDALRTVLISYLGLVLGYINKGILFVLILNTEQIGLINLILSVGLLFSQLSNLGAINSIAKFLPFFKYNDHQKQSFFLLNIFFVLLGICLFTLIVVLLQEQIIYYYSKKSALFVEYYFWIIPIGIANVLFIVFETYLRAIYKNILSVFVFEFLLRLIITLLLLMLSYDYLNFNQFFVIHGLIYFIPTLILFFYLISINEIKFDRLTLKISRKFKKIIISFSIYSYSNTLGVLVVMTMDALMIAYFLGLKETGVYTTVIYLTSAIQIPFKSLMRVSNPLVPQYWKEKNMNKMSNLYKKTSSISLMIALFMFLIVWCNIDGLFSYLPKEYLTGIWVFLFLMIGRIIDMYFGLNGWILVTSKKYKFDMIFTLVLLVLVFVLNVWLIPIYGIIGAAISTGFAMVVYNLCRMIFLYFTYKIHPFDKSQFYIILLFLILITLFHYIPNFKMNTIISFILNSILITFIYFGMIIKFKWNNDLNQYLNNILSRFNIFI